MLGQLHQGNEEIFESIYLKQFEPAMNYLKKRFNAAHENAYDVVMQTMADFFDRLKEGKIKYGNFTIPFLYKIVCAKLLSFSEKRITLFGNRSNRFGRIEKEIRKRLWLLLIKQ